MHAGILTTWFSNFKSYIIGVTFVLWLLKVLYWHSVSFIKNWRDKDFDHLRLKVVDWSIIFGKTVIGDLVIIDYVFPYDPKIKHQCLYLKSPMSPDQTQRVSKCWFKFLVPNELTNTNLSPPSPKKKPKEFYIEVLLTFTAVHLSEKTNVLARQMGFLSQ